MKSRVLVVDDDPEMVSLLERHLVAEGFSVAAATGGVEGIRAVEREDWDVILTDLVMGDDSGMAVLAAAMRSRPMTRVVLMTAFGSIETAIEAIRHGAHDYITKPFKLAELTLTVQRAAEDRRLRHENERLRAEVEREQGLGRILGESPSIRTLREQIRSLADSEASVLVLGESGSGKELVARALHWASARRSAPFVPVNCGAIPEPLLEAELFGHEKGAFTGADRRRQGLFAAAQHGTLFLDEIADLPLPLQVKLLRAVEDRAIRPVGSTDTIQLDIRVVSATNRDLAALVGEGQFREDLYYRLAVLPIRVPALRERPEDIPRLAARFLEAAAGRMGKGLTAFADDALGWMTGYRWPGNVRELQNVVERAAVLAKGPMVALSDVATDFTVTAAASSLRPTLADLERRYIRQVLDEAGGDKVVAARILGVSVRTLQRKAPEL